MGKRIPILIGFVFVILAVWMQISTLGTLQYYISRLENLAYDIQLRTKLFKPAPFKTTVAVVDVDDKSLDKEGRWPWSRAKLADLITKIQQAGAVVIALDMIFPEKENNIAEDLLQFLQKDKLLTPTIEAPIRKLIPLFDNDAKFAAALKQIDTEAGVSFLPRVSTTNILTPPILKLTTPEEKKLDLIFAKGYISNIPIIQTALKSSGFVNVYPDEDGVIRSLPVLIRYQDNLYPSLALEAVRLFLLSDVKLVTESYRDQMRLEGVSVGNHIIPTDSKARAIIPFRGRSFTLPYYSATDVLHDQIPKDVLLGKIVFIGTSAIGLGDLPATSVESVFPGVEIHATMADGILSDNFSYRPAWAQGVEIILTIVLGSILALGFPYLGPRLLSVMIIVIPTSLVLLNNWLWEETGLIVSIFIPILLSLILALVNMIYGYLFETRRRERLKEMFGQYVPSTHIDEMLTKSGSSYGLYGEDREMTVLFADIRNFTGLSENLTATQLKEMLNEFFTPMTEIIFKHTGTIDKYVGDLIMAFWGAPLKDKKHAQHAMFAALEMQKKISAMKTALAERGWPELQMGIGINSGEMSVGDMGSKFRRNYTVLGDAVNLASRIEGLTKFYGVKIIVTEFTKQAHNLFVFRELDRVRVKGKEKGIKLFELVTKKTKVTDELTNEIKLSEEGLEMYYQQDWQKAADIFSQLQKAHPEQKFYEIYLNRIKTFEKSPPGKDWDGVYTFMEK